MEWHNKRDKTDVEQDNSSGKQVGIFGVVLACEDKSAASKSGWITVVSNLAPILS